MQIQKGKIKRAQKVILYGPEGIGKTTIGAAFPDTLLIDVEHGSGHLDCDRVVVDDWGSAMQTIEDIYAQRKELKYKTVAIDTADWLEKFATEEVCRAQKVESIEDLGFGKGYVFLMDEMMLALAKLDMLINSGINVVIIAHSQVQKRELPGAEGSFDRYELKCTKRVTALLKEWADAVLFMNYKIIVEQGPDQVHRARGGTERLLMTGHTAAFDAKNRWGLEDELVVGEVDSPLPEEILVHLAENEPEKAEVSALQKLMKKHKVSEADILAVLEKQGVKRRTQKVEAQLVEQFDKVVAMIEGMKK